MFRKEAFTQSCGGGILIANDNGPCSGSTSPNQSFRPHCRHLFLTEEHIGRYCAKAELDSSGCDSHISFRSRLHQHQPADKLARFYKSTNREELAGLPIVTGAERTTN